MPRALGAERGGFAGRLTIQIVVHLAFLFGVVSRNLRIQFVRPPQPSLLYPIRMSLLLNDVYFARAKA